MSPEYIAITTDLTRDRFSIPFARARGECSRSGSNVRFLGGSSLLGAPSTCERAGLSSR
jgi:hypothetical protein